MVDHLWLSISIWITMTALIWVYASLFYIVNTVICSNVLSQIFILLLTLVTLGTCRCNESSVLCFVDCEWQRFAGLVSGSLKGAYNGSHIMCSYSQLIEVDTHLAEGAKMMNLTESHYILLARGPTNDIGTCNTNWFQFYTVSQK